MEQEQPNYYAIIPAEVRYCEDLAPNEKLLYGEITSLCNKTGQCFATNQYFAKLYKVEIETISRWVKHLINNGFITSFIDKENGNKRYIQLNQYLLIKNSIPIDKKINSPIDKKINENNINSNNKSNNKLLIKENIKEIIDYLNKKTNSKYSYTGKEQVRHINARLSEGYKVDDFKKVIDIKCKKWQGTEMEQYLRPSTLFGTKFENYLNEKDNTYQKPAEKPQQFSTHSFSDEELNGLIDNLDDVKLV